MVWRKVVTENHNGIVGTSAFPRNLHNSENIDSVQILQVKHDSYKSFDSS